MYHPQDNFGEIGPLDLGLGVFGPREKVLLRVEANAHPVLDPPTASLPLTSAALGDRFDGQALRVGAGIVARQTCQARIDDVADAGDGQGSLGDVGGQHYAPAVPRSKYALLLPGC